MPLDAPDGRLGDAGGEMPLIDRRRCAECRCDELDELEGWAAHEYAEQHLECVVEYRDSVEAILEVHLFVEEWGLDKALSMAGSPDVAIYRCPKTGRKWLRTFGRADGEDIRPEAYTRLVAARRPGRAPVQCRCNEMDHLEAEEAEYYASRHLKPVWTTDVVEGRQYVCPKTGKRWWLVYVTPGERVADLRLVPDTEEAPDPASPQEPDAAAMEALQWPAEVAGSDEPVDLGEMERSLGPDDDGVT